jgi:hypothetical protein
MQNKMKTLNAYKNETHNQQKGFETSTHFCESERPRLRRDTSQSYFETKFSSFHKQAHAFFEETRSHTCDSHIQ